MLVGLWSRGVVAQTVTSNPSGTAKRWAGTSVGGGLSWAVANGRAKAMLRARMRGRRILRDVMRRMAEHIPRHKGRVEQRVGVRNRTLPLQPFVPSVPSKG